MEYRPPRTRRSHWHPTHRAGGRRCRCCCSDPRRAVEAKNGPFIAHRNHVAGRRSPHAVEKLGRGSGGLAPRRPVVTKHDTFDAGREEIVGGGAPEIGQRDALARPAPSSAIAPAWAAAGCHSGPPGSPGTRQAPGHQAGAKARGNRLEGIIGKGTYSPKTGASCL